MTHLTVGEAVAWICTRNHEAVKEISGISEIDQLRVAMFRYSEGICARARIRLEETPPIKAPGYASSQQALNGIQAVARKGLITVMAYSESSHEPLMVSVMDFRLLELRACDDGRASCGLWSTRDGKFVWLEPLLLRSELEVGWPAPSLPKTIKIRDHILTVLLQASEEKQLRKEEGFALAEGLAGYKRTPFEEAWKLLPPERKVGRGKRGPARH